MKKNLLGCCFSPHMEWSTRRKVKLAIPLLLLHCHHLSNSYESVQATLQRSESFEHEKNSSMRNSKPLCKLADFSNKVKTLLLAMASHAHLAHQRHNQRQPVYKHGFQGALNLFRSWELPRLTPCLLANFGFSDQLALD